MNPHPINSNNSFEQQQIINLIGYEVSHQLSENVILTTVDNLYNWVRLSSSWSLLYGTACCFIEAEAMGIPMSPALVSADDEERQVSP